MLDNPKCLYCGQPLDIIIEKDGTVKINPCTNPDCAGNAVSPDPNRSPK